MSEALRDPWIEALLRANIRLYQTNYLIYGKSRLPHLIIGTDLVSGVLCRPEDL